MLIYTFSIFMSVKAKKIKFYFVVYTPCPEKNGPPKHVQITLWIENDSHHFSLYHEKPSICNVCVKFHDNQSVHCWDIAFYKKKVENCRRQHCQLTHACNAYLRPPISTPAHCASAFDKGSRKLLAEFPNKAFELIPTVLIMLETCVFSVSS